ncbi:MAG: bis(5'-nucleosyl)-tetraphosphatase (symmetrical) YqeK [Spirochaetales bacterium]
MIELEKYIRDFLSSVLSPERLQHSLQTAELAKSLGKRFGLDPEKAYLVGLLHDAGREIDPKVLLLKAESLGYNPSPMEKENPVLLHGLISAEIAKTLFQIQDAEMLEAIQHHTLGKVNICPLGAILYIADYLEPTRKFVDASFREAVLSLDSLEKMLLEVLEAEKRYRKILAPSTQALYDALREKELEKA